LSYRGRVINAGIRRDLDVPTHRRVGIVCMRPNWEPQGDSPVRVAGGRDGK
jgi:hypothetical protein